MTLCDGGQRRAGRVENFYAKDPGLTNSHLGETVSTATGRPMTDGVGDCLTACGWEAIQTSVAKLCTARGLAAQHRHDNAGSPLPGCGMSQAAGNDHRPPKDQRPEKIPRTRLIKRGQIPAVMVIVVAVRSFIVSRVRGAFGSYVRFPESGTADLIIQFEPKHVICEVYGPVGRLMARALRCWSQLTRDAGDRRVADGLAKGV